MNLNRSFKPGKSWTDTDGNLIQTHGGSVLYHNGTYYWYGENKDNYVAGGKNWHNGVCCYSSNDLYNWKNEGIILEPQSKFSDPMHPQRIMDRPHIVYNERTGQFVMWVKFAGSEAEPTNWLIQYMGIAVSEDIKKPFKMIKTINPLDMVMGDFDLWVDPRDGKGYFIADRVHTEVIIADLNSDYTDVTGYYSTHFPHKQPPQAREAPSFFKHDDRYFLLTSGTTGYHPNPTEIAAAPLMHGPYQVLGEACVNDYKHTSFDCQFSSVFPHPTRYGLYIAIGDRWMAKTSKVNGKEEAETSEAGYIWLPVRFEGDKAWIEWRDEWTLDEYPIDRGPKLWWE